MPLHAAEAAQRNAASSWYVGLGALAQFDESDNPANPDESGDLVANGGSLSLGFRPRSFLSPNGGFRLEAELNGREYGTALQDGFGNTLYSDDKGLKLASLMGNIYYDAFLTEGWTASMGGGFGYAISSFEVAALGISEDFSTDNLTPAYQYMFGLSYSPAFLSAAEIFLMYQHYQLLDALQYSANAITVDDFEANSLSAGLRFFF